MDQRTLNWLYSLNVVPRFKKNCAGSKWQSYIKIIRALLHIMTCMPICKVSFILKNIPFQLNFSINNTENKFHFRLISQMVRVESKKRAKRWVLFDSMRTIWLINLKLNEFVVLFIFYQTKTCVFKVQHFQSMSI